MRMLQALPQVLIASMLVAATTETFAAAHCEQNNNKDLPPNTQLDKCSGWYLGAGLGVSRLKPRIVNLPESLDQTSDVVLPTFFLGYDVNANWAVELHYSNQGQATFDSGAAIDYQHAGGSVLYHFGTHLPGWNAYGKLGLSQLETSLGQGRDDGGEFNYQQLKSTQLHLGAGVEYMAKTRWGLRLEALGVDKDSSEITLSLFKRFGRDGEKTRVNSPSSQLQPVEIIPEPQPKVPAVCNAPQGVLDGVYFVTASNSLTNESKVALNALIEQLLQFPGIEIVISAHTDSRGSDSYNLKLSEGRAASVRNYLQRNGVTNIQSKGFGEARPIGDNDTVEGRASNRRVEIEVLGYECDAYDTSE